MTNHKGVSPLGEVRVKGRRYRCGVCGEKKRMTRAHVPPQVAGNAMISPSYHLMRRGEGVIHGRAKLGGIHFFGHCADCNSRIGQRYDRAYADFADLMRPAWVKDWRLEYPQLIQVPDGRFLPGAVIRSIFLGMCAVSSMVRTEWPDVVGKMMEGVPVGLPEDLRLYVAVTRGRSARVSGQVGGFPIMPGDILRDANGTAKGIMAAASVYFPPLAWELVMEGDSLVRNWGWADVSEWSVLAPDDEHQVSEYFTKLPLGVHPQHSPSQHEQWIELFSAERTPFAECMNIESPFADPRTKQVFGSKAIISTDEIDALGRRRGYQV